MSQYGKEHFLHLYFPQYPHTEQMRRGGMVGGGLTAVRYVGIWAGKAAIF